MAKWKWTNGAPITMADEHKPHSEQVDPQWPFTAVRLDDLRAMKQRILDLEEQLEALRSAAHRARHELDQWVFADGSAAYRVERAEEILAAALAASIPASSPDVSERDVGGSASNAASVATRPRSETSDPAKERP